jgi:hypothetical protein
MSILAFGFLIVSNFDKYHDETKFFKTQDILKTILFYILTITIKSHNL